MIPASCHCWVNTTMFASSNHLSLSATASYLLFESASYYLLSKSHSRDSNWHVQDEKKKLSMSPPGLCTFEPECSVNDWTISCISSLSLFLKWLLDSKWSLHIFLCFQSTECWQNLQNNSSPDTYKSFGNCSALYWGVDVEFPSFFTDKDRAVGSRFAMLTLCWRERG